MDRNRRVWASVGVASAAVAAGTALALLRRRPIRPVPPVLEGGPLLIAHRGGSGLAPENTLAAFRQAVEDWAADMIELDVHASADGRCVVIHDPTVDRTTDGSGAVAALPLEELRRLDAGYRFSRDGGRTFPFRGLDIRIPTIEEVLEALPGTRLTIEVKAAAAQRPLFEALDRHGAHERVLAAGIHESERTLFNELPCAKSASSEQIRAFYAVHRLGFGRYWRIGADAVQVPERSRGLRIVSRRFVRDVCAQGLPVHVWTVDDRDDMRRLLDWGVDGIITDRPDRLADVLTERVGRPTPPAGFRHAAGPSME